MPPITDCNGGRYRSGQCIPSASHCDRIFIDCSDVTDEEDCVLDISVPSKLLFFTSGD